MWPVFLLFLIPIGGGIPAGVLLAQRYGLPFPVTSVLYFISDLVLALVFEPIMKLLIKAARKFPRFGQFAAAYKRIMDRTTEPYGGSGGPFTLILIAFGVDPMTGRTAAAAAGHGFVAGWSFAITGDMFYFWVIMAATLKLNAWIADPNTTMVIILVAMLVIPVIVRKIRDRFQSARG